MTAHEKAEFGDCNTCAILGNTTILQYLGCVSSRVDNCRKTCDAAGLLFLGCAYLDVDCARMRAKQLAKLLPHLLLVGAELRLLCNDCNVNIAKMVPSLMHKPHLHGP